MLAITLVTVAMVIAPNTIMSSSVHAASPKIHFTNGVASGDVTSSSAVLWVRTNKDAHIKVQVSGHANFHKIDFKGSAHATEDSDFTAKVTANGLQPGKLYFYRWLAGKTSSEVGTFKTAPQNNDAANVHFTWSGDTDASKINGVPFFGDWAPLKAAKSESSDFFIYLGDVIYSDARAAGQLPDVQTLDEFRQLYKDSRDIPALPNLLKTTSIYPVWDDHEVRTDWAGQTVDPTFYEIGKQSFSEYMPLGKLKATSDPDCAGPTQFRVKHWGKNADLIIIDTRSCRSALVQTQCQNDLVPTLPSSIRTTIPGISAQPPQGCLNAINDPDRTMLGSTQKEMLKDALLHSKAKFKFVVSSVSVQQTFALPYDGWEGYGAERKEILNFIRDNTIKNVIFLTTDLHLNLMNEVFIDRFTDPAPIAYEVVTGPIGAETDKNRILRSLPPALGPIFVQARENLLNLIGADCRNIDAYSYGSVSISKKEGIAEITLKDGDKNILHDDVNPNIECTKQFGNSAITSSNTGKLQEMSSETVSGGDLQDLGNGSPQELGNPFG